MKKEDSSKLLLINNFIQSFRWSIVSPFMPLFYYSLAGSFAVLNIVNYSSSIIASIFAIIWARISDSYGRRKPFIILSYITGIATTYMLAHINTIYELLILKIAGSIIGSAGGSSFSALLAKKFKNNRGKVLGTYNALGIAGGIIGNLISGYIYENYGIRATLEYISYSTVIPLAIVLLIDEEPEERKPLDIKSMFKPPKIPKSFIKYYLYHLYVCGKGAVTGGIYAIYFINYLGGSPQEWAMVVTLTSLLSLSSPFFGSLVDKYGVKFAYYYSAIGWILLDIGYILANDPVTFAIIFVLPISAAYWVAYNKIIFDASDKSERASFFSYLGLISSLSSMAIGVTAGYIADMFDPRSLLIISAILSVTGLIPLRILFRDEDLRRQLCLVK